VLKLTLVGSYKWFCIPNALYVCPNEDYIIVVKAMAIPEIWWNFML